MANRYFNQFFYTFHKMPVLVDCNFVVDSANVNGLGISSLKGEGVTAVYMHTSQTAPAASPNPAVGVIQVKLSSNYFRFYGSSASLIGIGGTAGTAVTASTAYVIVSLGTATLAQWQAVGLPVGITPAVGVGFIATASATIGGSATAAPTATTGSNIDHIEQFGNPNLVLNPTGPNGTGGQVMGGTLLFQCFKAQAVAAPADGTIIQLSMYLSNSSVLIKGE